MFEIEISHHKEYYDFLKQKKIPYENKSFSFLHFEQFSNLTSMFLVDYMITKEIEKLISVEVFLESEKRLVFDFFDLNFKQEIKYYAMNMIAANYKNKTYFSLMKFSDLYMKDIEKQIQNMLYDSIQQPSDDKNQEIILGEEKEDVLYLIVEQNGSTELEKKDCTIINSFSYYQQEQAVAEVLYYNPSLLIVYDSLHLLKPDMVICLKKTLRKKVVFLADEHPLRKNSYK